MTVSIAFVLFEKEPQLSVEDITNHFSAVWSDLPTPSDGNETDQTISFGVGEKSIITAVMPAPFPWSDLEGPCETSILWENATQVLKKHQSHAIVTVMGGEDDPIAASTLLTQATASVLAASPEALGVYWGNATLIIPKEIFIEFATDIMPEEPPLHIWVDFRVGMDGEKTSSGFSSGMAALGLMEFEAEQSPEPPGELHDRLMGLAHYLIENGPVINDGDTIGEDANEKIRVVFSKSAFGHEGKVMRLEYESSSSGKPWWKPW